MKLLWTALHELRKDAGFVLLLILELSVGICFLASSGALLHRLGQQLTLTRTLHLQDAWWSDTAIESSDLPFYEMPQTMDVALNLDGKEQEAVLSALPAGMEHRLCFDLLMEGSADELPVVLRDTLAEKDTVGRRYEILLATGEEPLRIRVVGTYAGGIDDFQGDSFSADVISGIYGDMIASQAHPYWEAHPQQAACLQTRQSGVLYFTDDPKQLSSDGALSLSENWTTSFWSQESNLFPWLPLWCLRYCHCPVYVPARCFACASVKDRRASIGSAELRPGSAFACRFWKTRSCSFRYLQQVCCCFASVNRSQSMRIASAADISVNIRNGSFSLNSAIR